MLHLDVLYHLCKFELLRAQPFWFALYHWRAQKGWLVTYLILSNVCWSCSWHHFYRLLDTKWQHSWSCFHDFQTSILLNRTQVDWKTAVCIFSVPFLLRGPVIFLYFTSPLSTCTELRESADTVSPFPHRQTMPLSATSESGWWTMGGSVCDLETSLLNRASSRPVELPLRLHPLG